MKRTDQLKSRNNSSSCFFNKRNSGASQKSYGTSSYSTASSSYSLNYGSSFTNKISLGDKAAIVKGMTGENSQHLVIGTAELSNLYWKFQKDFKDVNSMIEMIEGVLKKETKTPTDLFVL